MRDKVIELCKKGMYPSQIAREVGISRQRVHQILTGYQSFASNHRSFAYRPNLSKISLCPCGAKAIHTHHKDRNSNNNNEDNLLPLCSKCHYKIHKTMREQNNIGY